MLLAVAPRFSGLAKEGMQRPDSSGRVPASGATNRDAPFDSDLHGRKLRILATCSPFKRPNGCTFDSELRQTTAMCARFMFPRKYGACNFDSDCSYGEECRGLVLPGRKNEWMQL